MAFVLITLAVVLVIMWEFIYSGDGVDLRSQGHGFADHLGAAVGRNISARDRRLARDGRPR